MTREQTLEIMAVLRGAYPAFYRDMSKTEALDVVNLWAAMFADDEAGLVGEAVKRFIVTDKKGFPPSIGLVKDQMARIMEKDSGIVWQVAINAGKCRDAVEELGGVSRIARERGLSWHEAKQLALEGKCTSGYLEGKCEA